FLQFLFQVTYEMVVHRRIQQQHIVALFSRRLNVGVLNCGIGSIQIHQRPVLIGLQRIDPVFVFLQCMVFVFHVFKEREIFRPVVKFFVGNHAILYEQADVVPLFLVAFPVAFKQFSKFVRYFFTDVTVYSPHTAVGLKETSGYVERNIGRIDDPVEQHQKIGNNILNLIGNKHLPRKKLDLVPLKLQLVLYLGKIQDTGKIERIIHVQMDPEKGIGRHGIQLAVKRQVILVLQVGGFAGPGRGGIIDDMVLFYLLEFRFAFLILPIGDLFLAGSEFNGDGQELTVFVQNFLQTVPVQELLRVLVDMQDDIRSA